MDRQLIDAEKVTPYMTKKWCVLVQVIERRNARKKENGPWYRNYLVTDMKGTKVPIIVFYKNVQLFSSSLEPFKRYYVSNTTVKDTLAQFRVVEYPYTWTLQRKNLVEPYPETIPPPLPCIFRYDRFGDFYKYADQERSICIKALVVKALPAQQTDESSSTRGFVMINEEMIPMLVKVWDDLLVDNDVNVHARYKVPALIVGYGLKVTTLNGLSLRTKPNAYFLENPPLKEEIPLKEWYNAHAAEITELVQNGAYRDTARLFHPPRPSEILALNFALTSIENAKTVWTEGTITYIPQGKTYFEACEKCFTELDVDADWKIMCFTCQEYTNVIVRTEIAVHLKHGNTVVEATIKSPEIDRLLPFTSNEIRLAAEQDNPLTKEIEAALNGRHVVCFLKYYDRVSRGPMLCRCPIVKIYTEAEINEYHVAEEKRAQGNADLANQTSLEHVGSSSATPLTPSEKQFFTPTMKAVLEEVETNPAVPQEHSTESAGTKRMLAFEDPAPPLAKHLQAHGIPPCNSPENAVVAPSEDKSKDAVQTTPSKKLKKRNNEADT